MPSLETIEEHRCFDGAVGFYRHPSEACSCEMSFSVFLPPQAEDGPVPVLYYLAGLTCTEETFQTKGGAQRYAAEYGLMLVAPDTSPRGETIPDEEDWDFGTGAGFYVDATEEPWATNYNMYTYVTQELRGLIRDNFPARTDAQGIFGHSMGGHGALTLALKNPSLYQSVSAFAPICHPVEVPWGRKAFGRYLGEDEERWREHDATELVQAGRTFDGTILIDQGLEDQFLAEQLSPQAFEAACRESGQPLKLRRHPGYDHSYYFIATFMEDHIRHHARALSDAGG
ncbi:S-formylglutathione hydrolase [Rubrobacter calidifluminis]|uniref:S-formylglutathione hydrolase n=1 Tax=Rubrobacter calidifluminis TaxID=1392640 RepID=UPI002360F28F|nr:S-formylglutathione hydrolase [Rubrobacter calidifluminis]